MSRVELFITSIAKMHISGVLAHPQACKNLNIGGDDSMKIQFWGHSPYFGG